MVVAVLVAGAVALYVLGLRRPRADVPAVMTDGMADPVANLPPVLLPADPQAADIDTVRFSLGLRGYRMDQVDEVLDILRDRLARQEAEIESLTAAVAQSTRPAPIQEPQE